MKKIIKVFRNLRKPSLAKKISLYFIIFGIIVAYLSFIVFSIGSGRSLVKNMEIMISREFIKAHTGKYPPRKIKNLRRLLRNHRLSKDYRTKQRKHEKQESDQFSGNITYRVNDTGLLRFFGFIDNIIAHFNEFEIRTLYHFTEKGKWEEIVYIFA